MTSTLRKKVGQLFMVGFDSLEINDHITQLILEHHVGGVILFRRNVKSPEQVAKLCRQLQEINAKVHDQPLLIAIDQEGGMVMRIEEGVTPMPSAMAYQAAGSVQDCEEMHRISGEELRQLGINMNLAPVLDVNNNPLNPVIGVRAFGEDAETVIEYGMAAIRGLQSAGMIATAKHFPGHGDTTTDSHIAMPLIAHDRARLDAVELPPFKAAIAQGVHAIMTAHVVFPAVEKESNLPATFSKTVLTDLLRNEMKFNGVIISDCLEMAAIVDSIGVTLGAIKTLQAGADMALVSHQEVRQIEAINAVVQAVESNQIEVARIDDAFQRVRQLKGMVPAETLCTQLMKPESLVLARTVQKNALRVQGNFRPLNRQLPVNLITVEVALRGEMDEVTQSTQARGSMLQLMLDAGVAVRELVISPQVRDDEFAAVVDFVKDASQVVLQTYNAVLMPGQQRLITSLISSFAHEKLWLVAGRIPYDLDLAPAAQGRLANFGSRLSALMSIVDKLLS